MTEPEPRFCVLTDGVWHHLIGADTATDAGLDVDRAYCPEHDLPAMLIDYGECLQSAIRLNERFAGRWHCWFVALAGEVEWLARPALAEPPGEPLSASSAVELADRIDRIGRHM